MAVTAHAFIWGSFVPNAFERIGAENAQLIEASKLVLVTHRIQSNDGISRYLGDAP